MAGDLEGDLRPCLEGAVAGCVPVGVVEHLEEVEVAHDQRERGPATGQVAHLVQPHVKRLPALCTLCIYKVPPREIDVGWAHG